MLKILNTIILFILLTTKSYSEVINKVNVINNDRITQETILVFSNIEIGKNYSPNDLNEIIATRLYLRRENFEDAKSAIEILVSVEKYNNVGSVIRNKYLVSRFNLSDVTFGNLFIFQGISFIMKEEEQIDGTIIGYGHPEYEPQTITLNFYAQ